MKGTNFYDRIDRARSESTRLILLFLLSILLLGGLSALLVHIALNPRFAPLETLSDAHWSLVATTAIVTLGTILLGSALFSQKLEQGGRFVAELLGGTLLRVTDDPLEQRALNVVEEIAIAAQTPVPPLYLLRRESSINAFAAGFSPDDAVLGLTHGALASLTREELEGVVAHELSHILHRDSALNMRLLGVLHGVWMLASLGQSLAHVGHEKRRSPVLAVLGGFIYALGAFGAWQGRWIQAAFSRRRETLADASAVRLTRNPYGLAGALAQIGLQGTPLLTPLALEANHLFLASAGGQGRFDFSPHPPLSKRISALIPSWDGHFESLTRTPTANVPTAERVGVSPFWSTLGAELQGALLNVDALDPELRTLAREPDSARSLLLAGQLDEDHQARGAQLALLGAVDRRLTDGLPELLRRLNTVDAAHRLPLYDIALGSLEGLSFPQKKILLQEVHLLASQLGPYSHRQYALGRLVERHLEAPQLAAVETNEPPLPGGEALITLLAVLARRGHPTHERATAALQRGLVTFPELRAASLPELAALDVRSLGRALDRVLGLPLVTRHRFLTAAEQVVLFDGHVRPVEAELVRMFAQCLHLGGNDSAQERP